MLRIFLLLCAIATLNLSCDTAANSSTQKKKEVPQIHPMTPEQIISMVQRIETINLTFMQFDFSANAKGKEAQGQLASLFTVNPFQKPTTTQCLEDLVISAIDSELNHIATFRVYSQGKCTFVDTYLIDNAPIPNFRNAISSSGQTYINKLIEQANDMKKSLEEEN